MLKTTARQRPGQHSAQDHQQKLKLPRLPCSATSQPFWRKQMKRRNASTNFASEREAKQSTKSPFNLFFIEETAIGLAS
jgi:hypothetical protein